MREIMKKNNSNSLFPQRPGLFDECRQSAGWPPTPRRKLAATINIAIVIITQPVI